MDDAKEYWIFADESVQDGELFSKFFGGCIVPAHERKNTPLSLHQYPTQSVGVRFIGVHGKARADAHRRQYAKNFAWLEQNEREIDAALKRSAALRQSILKKAFTGQLAPQDPTDEPASALLERIRKERAVAAIRPKRP